jgi:hypothetical protein
MDLLFFIGFTCIQIIIYFLLKGHLNLKQQSWIFLLGASILFVLGSIPTLINLFKSISTNTYKEYFQDLYNNESIIHRTITIWFISSLFLDCVIGMVDYPGKFSWFHHIYYILNGIFALYHKSTSLSFLMSPMEIPTLIYGIGNIFPNLRSNLLFGTSLFLFRVLYEVITYIYLMATPDMPKMYISSVAFFPTIILHLNWIYKWATKYVF